MAVEEIKYDVVKTDGNIEIRDYKPVVIAEVTVEGTRREAPSTAFRTLFNYISGENVTAKVLLLKKKSEEKETPYGILTFTECVEDEVDSTNLSLKNEIGQVAALQGPTCAFAN